MATNNIINAPFPFSAEIGGTGVDSPTENGIMIAQGQDPITTVVLADGELPIGSFGNDPVPNTLTAGTDIVITNGPGTITISHSGHTIDADNINITDDDATNATMYPLWVTANSGYLPAKVSSTKLTFNPSTGVFTTTAYEGEWQGNTITETFGGTNQTTYTLGDTLYSSATNTLAKLSGNTTTTKMFLTQTGDGTDSAAPFWSTISGPDVPGEPLTSFNDANVTLTLGGDPTVALLNPASLTMGWTGELSLARGGTNAALTASNGGIVYSNASSMAILSGTPTANRALHSGASGAPTWTTATFPSTATSTGSVLRADGTNWSPSTATFADTYAASTLLYASAANTINGLPTANNGVLITSGSGVPSISSTLPLAVQTNITQVGTITSGIWNGTVIGLANGGTNAALTASNGGIVYSGASSFQVLAGTVTAGQLLKSGSSAAPSWTTSTFADTYAVNSILYASSANTVTGLATANNGVLITSGAGAPSISSTLPTAVQSNITQVGTISSGTWNGTNIALAHGGTNAALTASNGGIFYSTASAGAILAGTATANLPLLSGSSAAPTWGAFPISLGGALTTAGALTTTGAFSATFNFTNTTSVTFPTSGTLVALGSSPNFASETLTNVTNQLTLGTTNTTTINSVAPAASRTYTINDLGANGNVVLSTTTDSMTVYNQTAALVNPVIWIGTATTTTGVATFHPTVDGTTGTASLFPTNIFNAQATAVTNTTTAINYTFTSTQSISADRKTVLINCGTGRNLAALGATIANAPDGTVIHLYLVGN